MSNKQIPVIACEVNGIVGHMNYKGRRISAMCGRIKVCSNHCSLSIGECEHQYEVKGIEDEPETNN